MTNSKYVIYTNLTKHHSGKRTHTVDTITPHCIVGQWTAKQGCDFFASTTRDCSANYICGIDGIGLSVDEGNRSWCTSSRDNDQRAITIECASDTKAPYAFRDDVYARLIDLCVDICQRYGKTKLIWIADKAQALAYEPKINEMKLTVHRWFANKSCPGDWMMARMGELAAKVTERLTEGTVVPQPTPEPEPTPTTLYRVQVGAYKVRANADKTAAKLEKDGYNTYMVQVNGLYKVQTGAFKDKANADKLAKELKSKGYATFITT